MAGSGGDAGEVPDQDPPCEPRRARLDYLEVCQEEMEWVRGVTEIVGQLSVGEVDCVVADLDALRCLERVEGDLIFGEGADDLDALAQLQEVTGWLVLGARHVELPRLVRVGRSLITGRAVELDFPLLSRVGKDLDISSEGLTAVSFPRLDSVGGALVLPVDATTDLGFPALEGAGDIYLEGSTLGRVSFPRLRRAGSLRFANATDRALPDFPNLTEIAGLALENVAVTDLHGLDAVTRADGGFGFERNPNLESLAGLEQVTTAASIVAIENPKLESLEALGKIEGEIRALVVENNASLRNLDGLEGVVASGDRVQIEANPVLEDIDALSGLEKAVTVIVRANPLLDELAGFRGLQQIASLELAELDALTTTADLAALTSVEHDLVIQNCPALRELGFLPEVGGNFAIQDLPALETLAFPRKLVMDGGNLSISNTGLTRLEGFDQVTHLGSLNVSRNRKLESLRNFSGLEAVSSGLSVTDNAALPACEAEWLRDRIGETNIGAVLFEHNDGSGPCVP